MEFQDNPDAALGIKFEVRAVEHPRKSKEAGRPIFEDREFVSIIFPGDNKRAHTAPAHEMHYVSHRKQQMTYAERFRSIYDAWKATGADQVVGTPLSAAPFVTPSVLEELRHQRIYTVEQLAGLPNAVQGKLGMNARDLVAQANDYLKAAAGTAEVSALRAELEAMRAQMAQMAAPKEAPADPFEGMSRDDLFNIATDAGLEPRANASAQSLREMIAEAAKKKEAA